MPAFLYVGLRAPEAADLATYYEGRLGLAAVASRDGGAAFRIGETVLDFASAAGLPFYHFAVLVPGDRFEAMLEWLQPRVELLPDVATDREVFDFPNWDARACYFHDPAGNIVELIAHRGRSESGVVGAFGAAELVGVSEIGLVGDPPTLASALGNELGLETWDGTVEGEGRLAFVGEQGRTLILCRPGRPWLPTGRPAEAHPLEVALEGEPRGRIVLEAGGFVSRSGSEADVRCAPPVENTKALPYELESQ